MHAWKQLDTGEIATQTSSLTAGDSDDDDHHHHHHHLWHRHHHCHHTCRCRCLSHRFSSLSNADATCTEGWYDSDYCCCCCCWWWWWWCYYYSYFNDLRGRPAVGSDEDEAVLAGRTGTRIRPSIVAARNKHHHTTAVSSKSDAVFELLLAATTRFARQRGTRRAIAAALQRCGTAEHVTPATSSPGP